MPTKKDNNKTDDVSDKVDALVLHLVLTHHWYDEIVAGRKRIEYRKMSPHWKRLIWHRRDLVTHVRFQRGFERNPNIMTFKVRRIDQGMCWIDGWDGDFYRIHFGTQNDSHEGRGK